MQWITVYKSLHTLHRRVLIIIRASRVKCLPQRINFTLDQCVAQYSCWTHISWVLSFLHVFVEEVIYGISSCESQVRWPLCSPLHAVARNTETERVDFEQQGAESNRAIWVYLIGWFSSGRMSFITANIPLCKVLRIKYRRCWQNVIQFTLFLQHYFQLVVCRFLS